MRKLLVFMLALLAVSCGKMSHEGQKIVRRGDSLYIGGMAGGKRQGWGQLSVGGKLIYAGEWKKGLRDGRGTTTDSLGRRIVGRWKDGKLVTGERTDSDGVYTGELNTNGEAQGYGSYADADGSFYDGYWSQDERDGLGFSLVPGKMLRMGEWKHDRYLGERLEYTSHRIYGIDISRFQHDVGKKHYGIDWSSLRITSLGSISKKKVRGKVDYPVSFIYVKATEGISLRNRYFAADYAQAKAHGIHRGAYHFFSTRSDAAQQAWFFLKYCAYKKGDLPPVLDLEPLPSQIERMGGTGRLFAGVRTWMRIVERQLGVKPVLYINQIFVNRYLPSAPDIKENYRIWIARYGEYKPGIHLLYWQLSPDGRVRGIHPTVDINVFNGYSNQFNKFLSEAGVQ